MVLNLLEKILQQRQIKYRLGDRIFGPGLNLVGEAASLFVNVGNAWIGAHTNNKAGSSAQRIATNVEAAIQVVNDIHQTDGIHVEDGGRVGIVAHLRRVAGNANQVADTHGGGAQEIGLNAEDIPVAAGVVQDGFYAHIFLDQ